MKKKIIFTLLFILLFVGIDRSIGNFLNEGLNRYFGLNQYSQLLIIGHSHLMLAIDKETLEKETNHKVSKYCREGVNVADRYEMVKQYLNSSYADSLQIVFYGVDQFMFTGEGLSENSYKLFYPYIDNGIINEYIKNSTSNYNFLLHNLICTTRYSDALLNSSIRGWRNDWSNYKEGQFNVKQLKEQIKKKQQRKIHFEKELIYLFEKTLKLLTEHNIRIILVNTPIVQALNEYEPDSYQKMIEYFKEKATDSFIEYWDFNPQYSDNPELFFDPIHLNPKGQIIITKELIQRLNQSNH